MYYVSRICALSIFHTITFGCYYIFVIIFFFTVKVTKYYNSAFFGEKRILSKSIEDSARIVLEVNWLKESL